MSITISSLDKWADEPLRCYSLNLGVITGSGGGVQCQHSGGELFLKYQDESPQKTFLYEYMENHKTTILCNAGVYGDMMCLLDFMDNTDNIYPWSTFYESEWFLNGMLTSISIILPETIYEFTKREREFVKKTDLCSYEKEVDLNEWEITLARKIGKMPLLK